MARPTSMPRKPCVLCSPSVTRLQPSGTVCEACAFLLRSAPRQLLEHLPRQMFAAKLRGGDPRRLAVRLILNASRLYDAADSEQPLKQAA